MKQRVSVLFTLLLTPVLFGWTTDEEKWIIEKQKGYALFYTASDRQNIVEYKAYFEGGKKIVEEFFQSHFNSDFSIYVHPSRSSLDRTWQKDWNMPDFNSQCWMVASGVYNKLDIISPIMWDHVACEHIYSDSIKTQQLITHELVHVYHGQHNISPDFSNVVGIDWFIEGLAVYASRQCDSKRIADVKLALSENKVPLNLNDYWSGKLKYGLSGTLVMLIDKKYGRETLISLLKHNDIKDITSQLKTTEDDLLQDWREFIEEI